MSKDKTITVDGTDIRIVHNESEEYISLTDITKKFPDGKQLVPRWIRNKDTLEFLGVWEKLNNPNFRVVEFDNLYTEAGTNKFSLSIKRWLERTGGIGFKVKRGKSATTYAHKDIALGFCYWLSPPFQLYVIKEFQRLKLQEAKEQKETLDWTVKRTIAKMNYKIHSEAVKQTLIPSRLSSQKKLIGYVYASEADILNVALFGMTAKEWRMTNSKKKVI